MLDVRVLGSRGRDGADPHRGPGRRLFRIPHFALRAFLHMPTPDPNDIHFLDCASLSFRRSGSQIEILTDGKDDWLEVTFARLFPFSDPEGWVSVIDKDGKELGLIRDLGDLSSESRELIRGELERRYVMPRIRQVLSCRDRADMIEWKVETDRGPTTFLTRSLRDQAEHPSPNRLVIKDVDDNRYDIPNVMSLPTQSRRLLDERM